MPKVGKGPFKNAVMHEIGLDKFPAKKGRAGITCRNDMNKVRAHMINRKLTAQIPLTTDGERWVGYTFNNFSSGDYDMRDCYVANTAPKAKANKYVVGEKKSLQDLIIDGKQANARVIAPKVFLTKEEKVNKKRQTERGSRSRKKQRKQADADKFPEKSNHTQ